MRTMVYDGEKGLSSNTATTWGSTNSVHMRQKPPRQKAWLVERNNEIIRAALHKVETQLLLEGLDVAFEQVLATVILAKNCLMVINGATPYQALYGQQPIFLPPLEGGFLGEIGTVPGRRDTLARHHARVSEVSAGSILESIATARINRTDNTKTRPPGGSMNWEPGQSVDVWFEPRHKEETGWHGPAKVLSVDREKANVTVKHQGHLLFF